MSGQTEDVVIDYADVLLERAAKFQAILNNAGNAPVIEAVMLLALVRAMFPNAGGEFHKIAEAEIRNYVGLND